MTPEKNALENLRWSSEAPGASKQADDLSKEETTNPQKTGKKF